MLKGILLLLTVFFTFNLCAVENGKNPKAPPCVTKESCINDPNCFCWCSQICNWRKKEKDDRPVYIENDPYGKFCYCKQWDYDHYKDNCIEGKNVQQSKGAK